MLHFAEKVLELASPLVFKVDDVVDKDWVKTVQVSDLVALLSLIFTQTCASCPGPSDAMRYVNVGAITREWETTLSITE